MCLRRSLARAFGIIVLALLAPSAQAAFHLMKIVEVFPGTQASPSAQYVVIQMYASGQNFVSGHSILVYNAAGTQIASFAFTGNVANGANQAKILIATTQAVSFFNVSSNLTMTAVLPLPGGKVCFDAIDCVAWGNYTGSLTGVGTPFNQTGGGLRQGRAIRRKLGANSTLEAADDTGVSANDFEFATPAPRNNAGTAGTIPPSVCGNSALTGLEACDDGNTVSGDGCRADCLGTELCGDQRVDVNETCDDGNTVGGDSCPANCSTAVCGNGNLEPGETCDDGNQNDLDACGDDCENNFCGDGQTNNGEQCDDGNQNDLDACGNDCQNNVCGDGQTNNGEQCDDGNQDDLDACGNDCQNNVCGDGQTNNGEQCDDGNQDDLDACGNDCQNNVCGDGQTNNGEQCDDGNQDDLDACGNDCQNNVCGDGQTNNGEQCDDGNQDDLDACGNDCQNNVCGDGQTNNGEQCDDGNLDDLDACGNDCLDNVCGDGQSNNGEECDDGNLDDLDACGNDCLDNVCGDGQANNGEQCDDGNTVGGDGCPADCGVIPGVEEASPLDLRAERGEGTAVSVTFTPACGASDHAIYWGRGPIQGAVEWDDSACALGTAGSASFAPGTLDVNELVYFVVVGYHDDAEGSYGQGSNGTERPESVGLGACDRPLSIATCSEQGD